MKTMLTGIVFILLGIWVSFFMNVNGVFTAASFILPILGIFVFICGIFSEDQGKPENKKTKKNGRDD